MGFWRHVGAAFLAESLQSDRKVRRQVCKRIDRRLRELGLADVEQYRDHLEAHRQEWASLDSFCRISISRFYRDRGVFDFVRDAVLPDLATVARTSPDRTLWCWSAGCASGEEPYTVNILWRLCLSSRFPDVTLRIVASDSNPVMLDRARRGSYTGSGLKDVPKDWLSTAFFELDGLWQVKREFRRGVDFVLQDIRRQMPEGQFHLVLCRHSVFTYFDETLQHKTLQQILDKLLPGGVLIIGKQEAPSQGLEGLQKEQFHGGVYRKT